jgi:hypothetical protein
MITTTRLACVFALVTSLAVIGLDPSTASSGAASSGAVRFVGAAHADPAAQKSKSVVVPSGTAAGDTLVLIFTRTPTQPWTGPSGISGWQQVDTTSGANSLVSTVWVKQAAPGDLGTSVHFDLSTAAKGMLSLASYS